MQMKHSHIRRVVKDLEHRYGMRPTPAHHPFFANRHHHVAPAPSGVLPASMDLRKWNPGIHNQGSEGACTGFGTAEFRDVLWGAAHGVMISARRSPAYLYARTRMAEGTFPQDSGASMADEFSVLHSYGVCAEDDMPYDQDPAEPIPNIADADAVAFRIGTPATVDMTNPNDGMTVLANSMPIGISIPVYQSFEDCGSDGMIPIPDPSREALLGGHGLCIMGYDAAKKVWLTANSWDTGWGDDGYCYIPFDYPFWEGWTAAKV